MKTVDISGMDPKRERYGYEWGCQVLMFRALDYLRKHPDGNAKFHGFKNITGIMIADNDTAKEMEKYALAHQKIKEYGATGAMVQYALLHALQRFKMGDEKYFAELSERPAEDFYDFDVTDAFEEGEKHSWLQN